MIKAAPLSVTVVTLGGLLRGIGMTPILGLIFTMIADAIEYRFGLRAQPPAPFHP